MASLKKLNESVLNLAILQEEMTAAVKQGQAETHKTLQGLLAVLSTMNQGIEMSTKLFVTTVGFLQERLVKMESDILALREELKNTQPAKRVAKKK